MMKGKITSQWSKLGLIGIQVNLRSHLYIYVCCDCCICINVSYHEFIHLLLQLFSGTWSICESKITESFVQMCVFEHESLHCDVLQWTTHNRFRVATFPSAEILIFLYKIFEIFYTCKPDVCWVRVQNGKWLKSARLWRLNWNLLLLKVLWSHCQCYLNVDIKMIWANCNTWFYHGIIKTKKNMFCGNKSNFVGNVCLHKNDWKPNLQT